MNHNSIDIKRIISVAIDLVLVSFLTGIITSFIKVDYSGGSYSLFGLTLKLTYSFSFLLYLVYFLAFDLFNQGTTIGKLLLKLKIVSNTESTTTSLLVKRTLLKMLSIILLPISMLLYLFNKGYTIHDDYLKTTVVDTSANYSQNRS